MDETFSEENPSPVPLTLASRQRLAKDLQVGESATAILVKNQHLEGSFAELLDSGEVETAFRLIARMLKPAKAMIWLVMSHRFTNANQDRLVADEVKAETALIEYARDSSPDKAATAESACRLLGGTHPLGLAGSSLSTLQNMLEGYSPFSCSIFPDLVARSVWLMSLSESRDRERSVLSKELASRGVALALSGQAD